MPRITVFLDEQEARALSAAAAEERRTRSDQAAVLIVQALRARPGTADDREPAPAERAR